MTTLVENQKCSNDPRMCIDSFLDRVLNPPHLESLTVQYLIATVAISSVTYLCFQGGYRFSLIDVIMLYFATTYLLAYRSTLGPALWASILSLVLFDYFFTQPIFQFDFNHALPFSIMLLMILLTNRSTARIRRSAVELEDTVALRTSELAASNKQLSEEIAKNKITAEKLRRTVDELGRSNAMLQQFARVASHDLQEPLRAIQGYVGLFESRYKDKLDANGNEFLEYIVDGTKRMEQLVKGILEHATVSYSTRKFENVEVEKALEDACANLQVKITETGATVTHDELPRLIANKIQLTQLFQNLIGNALKFQRADKPPVIHVSCEKYDSGYIFAVQDNGIGIEKQYQRQIFEMFKRLHSTQTYPGSGLGLAICKAIVVQHSGEIWVESEHGKGAKFCFKIPSKS